MSNRRQPHLHRSSDPPAAPKGRLLTAAEISTEVFRKHKTAEWIRRNVPKKIQLGHSSVMWYEADVWEFIESRKEGNHS